MTNGSNTRGVILDANTPVEYHTIYEIINATVGTNYTGWMKGVWPHNFGNGNYRIWFPKLAKVVNGKPVTSASGCINSISDDGQYFYYDDIKGGDYEGKQHYFGYDLIFAKDYNGEYYFRGVYMRDKEKSSLNHCVSKRVGTKVLVHPGEGGNIEILS